MYSNKSFFLQKIDEEKLNKLTKSNDTNLQAAILAADSLIDSYVGSVTTVPLDPVPEVIKQLSYDLAVFHLHDRIQYTDIPERVKDKYDAAISFLKDVAARKAAIPGLTVATINAAVEYTVNPSKVGW